MQGIDASAPRRVELSTALLAVGVILGPILWFVSSWAVHLVYDERLPLLSSRLFRSRETFDVDFYLSLTYVYRLGLAVSPPLLGLLVGVGGVLNSRLNAHEGRRESFGMEGLSRTRSILLLVLVYLLARGPLVLSLDGVWWDDWTLVTNQSAILSQFRQAGLPWIGILHLGLSSLGPAGYHVISLILFFSQGLIVYVLVGTIRKMSDWERVFFCSAFLVLPLNAARHTMIVLPYTMSITLFLTAWWILVRATKRRVLSTITAAALFLVSFTTGSLLVFFIVPVIHLWWLNDSGSGWSAKTFARRYSWLFLLPLGYFSATRAWFVPYGAFEGYNALSARGLIEGGFLGLLTGIALLSSIWFGRSLNKHLYEFVVTLSTGAFLVAIAVFPYVAVGARPLYRGWSTRHELLVPFGASVILLAIVRLMIQSLGTKAAAAFGALILVFAIGASAQTGIAYRDDWQKQRALIQLMAESEMLKHHSLFVFVDETLEQNVFGYSYRFYAWNGMLTRAFGDSTRLGLNPPHVDGYLRGKMRPYYGPDALVWGSSEFVEPAEALIVTISSTEGGEYAMSWSIVSLSDLSRVFVAHD